ncbi:MAG: transposase [Patescibacteria group bacterium]|nr:transposase [Patescibacteria group bacterium]
MPHKTREFVQGEIYHIVIRRAGNEELFLDIDDYYRGIFCIYEFNTTKPIIIRQRRLARARFKKYIKEASRGRPPADIEVVKKEGIILMRDSRDLLVEVLAFCLMPNHIHLLVRQLKEGGISKFMLKLESGYAAYFKNKYGVKIKGHFFQDRFKCVHIKTEEQLRTVFVYLHTNPIALIEPHWKEKGIKDPERAIKFLEKEYRWSSFLDYLGKKNFPSVTQRDFLLEIMEGSERCKKAVEEWVRYKGEIREFAELALEK